MNILVLSAKPDNCAAAALYTAATDKGVQAEMIALESFLHEKRYRKLLNKTREWWSNRNPAYRGRVIPAAAALCGYINSRGFDAVICTDTRSIRDMAAARESGAQAKFFGVPGEWMNVRSLRGAKMDGCFLAHEELRDTMCRMGAQGDRLFPYGMPVDKGFGLGLSKKDARNYLFIPEDKRVYLLLSEDMPYAQVCAACDELIRTESGDYIVYVCVERDSAAGNRLKNDYRGDPHIAVITTNRKMNILMGSADVALAQPHAYVSYEAAVSGVPLVHLSAVGGRQTAEYYSKNEMSMTGRSVSDAVAKARRLTRETALAHRMVRRQRLNTRNDAAERIIDRVIQITQNAQNPQGEPYENNH